MGHPKGKKNHYYSRDEKIRVVKAVLSGKSSKEVGSETGIGDRLIRSWVSPTLKGSDLNDVFSQKTILLFRPKEL